MTDIAVANRMLALCFAPTSVTRAWAVYLADKTFQTEPALRNRLFCLLICGLTDAGKEFRARANGIRIDASKIEMKAAAHYLAIFSSYVALALDVVAQLDRDEMIFITELRNQWLHGRWDEIFKSARPFYYVRNGEVVKEKIVAGEVSNIMRNSSETIDERLSALRERVSGYRTFFWAVDNYLGQAQVQEAMMSDLIMGAAFAAPSVALNIPSPTYKPSEPNPQFLCLSEALVS